MTTFKTKLREHKIAIILAILASLIVAFPQLYFRIEHRNDGIYQGIELLPDSPWSARVREIQDGHGFGSIYYKEGKDSPYLHTPLGSMVVAYMGKAFSLDINNTLLLSRLVLPFFAFLFIYIFVLMFSRSKLAALSSASVILLADSILNFYGIFKIFEGISPSSFLELTRPVYSLMIFVPFFAFMVTFWQFFQKRDSRWGAASAVILGLNFYNYFYIWTYLYAFGLVLFALLLIRKNWPEAKRIAWVFIGAAVVGIPYAINLYKANQNPLYEELGLRHGIVHSRDPLFIGLFALLGLVAFLLWFPRENREKYFFSLALLLTPIVTMNQQLITGISLQTGHYHWYFHRPIAVIFILYILFGLLAHKGLHFYKRVLAVLIIATSFATGFFVQAASYVHDPLRDGGHIAIERQKYGPVMRWLNDNAEKDEVVLANNEASHMTTIYTPLNVFHHRSAQLFLPATEERLLDAVFTFFRLRGIERADAREVFLAEVPYISSNVYGIYYKESHGSYGALPDEKFEEILALYQETLNTPASQWFRGIFEKYEVSYIIWDKAKDPLWKLDRFNYLEKAAEFGNMAIYRVN